MRQAVFHALEQADRRGAKDIATADLLLGMARVTDCSAATLLKRLGVTPERLDQQTRAGEEPAEGAGRTLTPDARRAVEQAYALAAEMGTTTSARSICSSPLSGSAAASRAARSGKLGLSMDTAAREPAALAEAARPPSRGGRRAGPPRSAGDGIARALAGARRAACFPGGPPPCAVCSVRRASQTDAAEPVPVLPPAAQGPFYFDDLIGSWFVTGHPEGRDPAGAAADRAAASA